MTSWQEELNPKKTKVADPADVSLKKFAETLPKRELRKPNDPNFGECTCKAEGMSKGACLGCHEKAMMSAVSSA